MLNLVLLLVGIPSLLLAIWSVFGLLRRGRRQQLPARPLFLGVCADYAHMTGIPVRVIRLYQVFYGLLGIGWIFYGVYYLVMRTRPVPVTPLDSPTPPPKVTKIESHHY